MPLTTWPQRSAPTSWPGLLQALGPAPELADAARLLRSSAEADLERLLPAVINGVAGSGRQCALILDDYHLIGAPAIRTAVAALIEHLSRRW